MPPPQPRGERALDVAAFFDRTVHFAVDHELERMQLLTMNGSWCKVAEKLALCCVLFVVAPCLEAQNLVPNGSFELTDTCPYTVSFQEGDQPLHWRTWLNSPDYFNACADTSDSLATLVSVPQNGWAFQYAQDGDAYAGFYAYYTPEYREFLGAPLTEPLTEGETYYASFWVNMADSGNYFGWNFGAVNNMGLLFTMNSNAWVDFNGPPFPFRNYAHVYRAEVLTDTAAWTLVNGSFVADSAYQYVVLGNFFDNAHTEVLPVPPGNGEYSYCLIDNVCVSPNPNGCDVTAIDEVARPVFPTAFVNMSIGNLIVVWPGHPGFHGDVMDMSGRIVSSMDTNTDEFRMPLGDWSAGVYIVRLTEGKVGAFVKFVIPR